MLKEGDSSNRQKIMVACVFLLTIFTAKHQLIFVLTQETLLLRGFIIKPVEKP